MTLKAVNFNSRDDLLNFVKKLHQQQLLTIKNGVIQTPLEVLARQFIVANHGQTYLVADLLSLSQQDINELNLSFFSQNGEVHSVATVILKLREGGNQHEYVNNKPLADTLIAIKYSPKLLYSNQKTLDVITRAPSFLPVITRDEINFDKQSLLDWVAYLGAARQAIFSPSTRRPLLNNEIFDNHALLGLTRLMLRETKDNLLRYLAEYYQEKTDASQSQAVIDILITYLRDHESGLATLKNQLARVVENQDNRNQDIQFFDDLNRNEWLICYEYEKKGETQTVLASDIATSLDLAKNALHKLQFSKIKLTNYVTEYSHEQTSPQRKQEIQKEIQALTTWLQQYENECNQVQSKYKMELMTLPSVYMRYLLNCLPSKTNDFLTIINDSLKSDDGFRLIKGMLYYGTEVALLCALIGLMKVENEFTLIASTAVSMVVLVIVFETFVSPKRQSISSVIEPKIVNAVATIKACKNAAEQQKSLTEKLARHEPITLFFASLKQNDHSFQAINNIIAAPKQMAESAKLKIGKSC